MVDSDAFGGAEVWTGRVLAHLPADVRASVVVTGPVAGRLAVPDGVERVVVPLARHRERSPEVAAALDRAPTVVTLHLHGAARGPRSPRSTGRRPRPSRRPR